MGRYAGCQRGGVRAHRDDQYPLLNEQFTEAGLPAEAHFIGDPGGWEPSGAAALPHVTGDDYMVDQWLAAYALLLMT